MKEAEKLKAILTPEEWVWFSGEGLDIGCGDSLFSENCQGFDLEQRDANHITNYVHKQFDFVFSSHCLEHMDDPFSAILEWWQLVKPAGYLIVIVPDEDLYEQGIFPSTFNPDHKHTFTISKRKSWSPVSVNVFDLIKRLPNAELLKLELQDLGYDRSLSWANDHGVSPEDFSVFFMGKPRERIKKILNYFFPVQRNRIDQTLKSALAQIMIVLQKKESGNE